MIDGSRRRLCGVYLMRAATGELYVGSSIDCKGRWRNHCKDMRDGKHNFRVMEIVAAHRGTGVIAFEFAMLEECDAERLVEREQHWMDVLKPTLNAVPVAGRKGLTGFSHRESSKQKTAVAMTGRKRPPHVGAAVAAANRARSPAARASMGAKVKARYAKAR